MSWRPILSFFHININRMDVQGNPRFSVTVNGGNHISQTNSQQPQPYLTLRTPSLDPHSHDFGAHALYSSLERRVEAQPRIRRMLDEACGRPGSVYGIEIVSQIAVNILSVIEGSPTAFRASLVDLAMDAHAVAYIGLIACLYRFDQNGRRRITRSSVRRLRKFLKKLHRLLVDEPPRRGVLIRIKEILSKGRVNDQELHMQEELLDILRDIEKDENAEIMKSLSIALDCPYQ